MQLVNAVAVRKHSLCQDSLQTVTCCIFFIVVSCFPLVAFAVDSQTVQWSFGHSFVCKRPRCQGVHWFPSSGYQFHFDQFTVISFFLVSQVISDADKFAAISFFLLSQVISDASFI